MYFIKKEIEFKKSSSASAGGARYAADHRVASAVSRRDVELVAQASDAMSHWVSLQKIGYAIRASLSLGIVADAIDEWRSLKTN